jgi:hypothetical protein
LQRATGTDKATSSCPRVRASASNVLPALIRLLQLKKLNRALGESGMASKVLMRLHHPEAVVRKDVLQVCLLVAMRVATFPLLHFLSLCLLCGHGCDVGTCRSCSCFTHLLQWLCLNPKP